jgi:hypothetical protein
MKELNRQNALTEDIMNKRSDLEKEIDLLEAEQAKQEQMRIKI